MITMLLFLFSFGLIFGSFLNALVFRVQNAKTMWARSMCPKCKHQIAWYDNIPLLSYLFLSGKCRSCHKPISIQYPLVEFLTGLCFALVGALSAPGKIIGGYLNSIFTLQPALTYSGRFLIYNSLLLSTLLFITGCLVLIAVYDLKTKEIPNGFNFAFIISSAIYLLFLYIISPNNYSLITNHLLAAIVLFLVFWALVYFSKETWMGGGDAKFVFGMGLLLGPAASLLAVLIASISGSVYGISAIMQKTKDKRQKTNKNSKIINQKNIQNSKIYDLRLFKNLKPVRMGPGGLKIENSNHEVPFGPFLALGTFTCLIFGPTIINWYLGLFL